jgi:dienelactone hydrolase
MWLIAAVPVLMIAGLVIWLWGFGPFRAVDAELVVPLHPPVLADAAAAWRVRRAEILGALDAHIYGPPPQDIAPRVTKAPIPAARAGGVEGVEQWRVDLGAAGSFHLVLVLPRNIPRPAPVILMQNFSGNRAAFPGRPKAIAEPLLYYPWICKYAVLDPVLEAMFGEHINAPPLQLIASRGYALALVYAGDVVPDRPKDARDSLAGFKSAATGALSAWAWVHSRALDVLLQDGRIDSRRVAVWGQSRQGKASLLAGARDERFAAIVSLQAGRGGDAPTQHRSGESVRAILLQFPHWFAPRYRDYLRADPPVDQHQLIAAIAPRPLLTGHARRDAWADPVGGRSALAAAGPVWDLLAAQRPHTFMRAGRHGIQREDWLHTLDFLDARMR